MHFMVLSNSLKGYLILKRIFRMFVNHLALTFKCHSSIGNSLDLHTMINEIIFTFVEETNALNGFFYLIDENNSLYLYHKYNDSFLVNEEILKECVIDLKFVKVYKYLDKNILIIPLDKGFFVLVYENEESNFDFLLSMFQDLIVKLNIGIDACLNVQKMKAKNKMLKHLTNELKEQKQKLIESDKYKTNFLANMSHELKTPLNSIIVISAIMSKNKNNKLEEDQVKNLKIINNCGNDLLMLINDVLDISKIEAGQVSINLSKVNINELIESLIYEMQPLALDKGLKLNSNCLLHNIVLLTDANKMKQILKNLISNAIKFMEKGDIVISLDENANDITIKVIDQGIGIAQEKLGHIFERFKQADGSTTRKYGGTGLGLAISKELALLLGGDIKAFSILGKGSSFELILPKKTNIKNISDDNVNISSNNNDDVVIEDIVLFDLDMDLEKETNKHEHKILVINSDYTIFFPVAVALKKANIDVIYSKSIKDNINLLAEYGLFILFEDTNSTNVEEFISYCILKDLKYLIVSHTQEEDDSFIKRTDVKSHLLEKILATLGK